MKRSFKKFEARLKETGRHGDVVKWAQASHVSLRELYDGPRTPSVVSARRVVYSWLMQPGVGMGLREVARLFDRAPNGILMLIRGRNGA